MTKGRKKRNRPLRKAPSHRGLRLRSSSPPFTEKRIDHRHIPPLPPELQRHHRVPCANSRVDSDNDLGGAEEALGQARKLLGEDATLDASEALLWAKLGDVKRADEMIARAEQNTASVGHGHHTEHYLASTLAILGRPVEATAKLRVAVQTGLPNYPLFGSDPHLDSIRDHPEMKSLMSELERDWREFRREFSRA